MEKNKTDVPTALFFFNRPDVLKITFDAIKKAKPSILFLIQDGPRKENATDIKKMEECRKIVDSIDWDCKVYKNYSDKNLGTGQRIYSGISWCFEYVDKLCIIEDDCVPSIGFFKFCSEILEKYNDDQRIDMISGMNNLGVYETTPYSYVFSSTGSIWGWATWKRAWDTVDYEINFIEEKDTVRLIKNLIKPERLALNLIKDGKNKREQLKSGEKLTSWSYQRGMNMYLNHGLIIVPKKNLISNIGLTEDAVHTSNSITKTPKSLQKIYFMDTYELETPLLHPKHIIRDVEFDQKMNKLMNPNPFISFLRKVEGFIRRIVYR